jgi:adenine-specific DNA-methyltransferase
LAGGEETMNEFETKQAIVAALKKFPSSPLGQAASDLLGVLGYTSKKRLALKPNTLATFLTTFSEGRSLNERYALPNEWKSVDILFQLTDEEVRTAANAQFEFESKGAFSGAIINSYLFVAIELKGEHYSRSALAGITREVNKLFTMPALIFFRHGETITLAVINRRLHKREPGKDVLEKVTLIQDIRPANTHRAHIEILRDLSLGALHQKHPFTNFVGLHEAWQKTLDTSELNKRFFQDLANWYFWALPQVRFPKNAPKDADSQDSLSLIRLITRVIFCWFLKEKGLLPSALFDEHTLPELLVDLNPKESTYYKAILQNLFFATLNQEMGKREFRKTGQNFMAHNVYRYRSLLKSPNELLNLLAQIPFMNGGLFECLDKTLGTKENPQYIRIDGFSDRDDNVLKIPNSLFWGPEKVVDLSEAYGEAKYSASRVAGLVRIFDRYKFTITENTPLDEEIALDPELLGKVFENLLAAYNPETGATARKQTGSFYTPREIVNYMVDESLISSLRAQIKNALPKAPEVEERLRQLMAYSDEPHQFADDEVTALIYAIDRLRILDPACGSGAFPMGILHKLVYVLTKLDPGNQRWKERQLVKANEIPDSTVRERVVSDIEQSFNANELDYGRKLFLIENCIYGVDIQPIAVQISKLRFFISLLVDQKVNPSADNLGIRPLPNLETKFVAANSLLDLKRPGQQLLRNHEIDAKEVELHRVRERHFLARTPATKAKCREQDATLRAQIAELLRSDGWDSTTARALASWDPYDQNASAPFYDTEWMFGIVSGFDAIIGNPPYIRIQNIDSILAEEMKRRFKSATGKFDVYVLFVEACLKLVCDSGIVCFIHPHRFLTADYGRGLKTLLDTSGGLRSAVLFGVGQVFETATTYTGIFIYSHSNKEFDFKYVATRAFEDIRFERRRYSTDGTHWILPTEGSGSIDLVVKLKNQSVPMSRFVSGIYQGIVTVGDDIFVLENISVDGSLCRGFSAAVDGIVEIEAELVKPLVKGEHIRRYGVLKSNLGILYPHHLDPHGRTIPYSEAEMKVLFPLGYRYFKPFKKALVEKKIKYKTNPEFWFSLHRSRDQKLFDGRKLITPQLQNMPHFTFDKHGWYPDAGGYSLVGCSSTDEEYFLLGVLNSKVLWYYIKNTSNPYNNSYYYFKTKYLESFTLPLVSPNDQHIVADLARQAIALRKGDAAEADILKLEAQIDERVYAHYGLTKEEIKTVEKAASW